MKQSKFMSLVESIGNVVLGFGIACTANIVVLPWFGFNVTLADAFHIGIIMTVISIARSFLLRRLFEWIRVNHGNYNPFLRS